MTHSGVMGIQEGGPDTQISPFDRAKEETIARYEALYPDLDVRAMVDDMGEALIVTGVIKPEAFEAQHEDAHTDAGDGGETQVASDNEPEPSEEQERAAVREQLAGKTWEELCELEDNIKLHLAFFEGLVEEAPVYLPLHYKEEVKQYRIALEEVKTAMKTAPSGRSPAAPE